MDLITTAIKTGATAYVSKDLLKKLLGPTAEYLGEEVKGLVQKCNINLGEIFNKAVRKAGSALDTPGSVSPRVLKSLIDDAGFCDDGLIKEYYGGILAGSRSPDSSNDIAISHLAMIKTMSTYQIRLHHYFYFQLHKIFAKAGAEHLGDQAKRAKKNLFIPFSALFAAFQLRDAAHFELVTIHAVAGLVRHGLLVDRWQFGDADSLKSMMVNPPSPGLIIGPTLLGIELFVWANGKRESLPSLFLLENPIDPEMKGVDAENALPVMNS